MWFDLLFYIWVVVDFFSSPGIAARLTSIPVGFPQCLCSYPRISRRFRGKSVIPRRVHISRVNSVIKLNTRELWRDLIVMTDVDCCRWRSVWNIAADWRPHLSRMWHHWLLNFSRYAMHERDPAIMQCLSVCVCPSSSRSWIASKRINISSKCFHRQVAAKPFYFSVPNGMAIFWREPP